MGLRIANNIAALNTHRWLSIADANVARSLERLSSGYRVNKAADDAAGLAISSRFRAQIRSLQQAQRNTSQAISMLQVAEGSLNEIHNILERLKELATEAASDTVGDTDRSKIDSEADALLAEIDRISQATKYSDTQLIYSTATSWGDAAYSAEIQVGYKNEDYDKISISLKAINTATLGVNNLDLHKEPDPGAVGHGHVGPCQHAAAERPDPDRAVKKKGVRETSPSPHEVLGDGNLKDRPAIPTSI